ncbi:MAG: hypothetical protein FWH07_08335 [Oscillospiraceae bacterium]|nr:hypothetical protein [Oscillospiraceae bacterium]
MKKNNNIKLIVENPPTQEHKEKKLKELGEFLSKELSSKRDNKGLF